MIAVFLDCNGVISEEREDYIKSPEEFIFLQNSIDAIKLLNRNNFPVIIVSNQAGISKGKLTIQDLDKIHKKMINELQLRDAYITATYYCIHYPFCENRKPNPGMLKLASKKYNIDLQKSYMIGDRDSDMKAGKSVGCKTIFLLTGFGNSYKNKASEFSDYIEKDLLAAAKIIIEKECVQTEKPSFSYNYDIV